MIAEPKTFAVLGVKLSALLLVTVGLVTLPKEEPKPQAA